MRNDCRLGGVLFLLSVMLTACVDPDGAGAGSGQDPERGRSGATELLRRKPDDVAAANVQLATSRVPHELQFPGVQSVQIGDSWQHRLSSLSERDREWLERVNSSYAGALAFEDRKQQEWMIANGYPMPEEWLASRAMTDPTLERLAKSGNTKAQFFHIDRVAERSVSANADGKGIDPSDPDGQALLFALGRTSGMVQQLEENVQSPFAAIVAGRFFRANASYDNSARLAAGIVEAGRRGDPRADRLLREFMAAHPTLTMAEVNALVDSGSSLARAGAPAQ